MSSIDYKRTICKSFLEAYGTKKANKAFKSNSQRLAFSLRSSIAKRSSHLNAALPQSRSSQERESICHSEETTKLFR